MRLHQKLKLLNPHHYSFSTSLARFKLPCSGITGQAEDEINEFAEAEDSSGEQDKNKTGIAQVTNYHYSSSPKFHSEFSLFFIREFS